MFWYCTLLSVDVLFFIDIQALEDLEGGCVVQEERVTVVVYWHTLEVIFQYFAVFFFIMSNFLVS